MAQMGRPEMVAALGEVADILGARRQTARIYIVGGAAIAMAYDSDRFTHDIDAVVLDGHSARRLSCSRGREDGTDGILPGSTNKPPPISRGVMTIAPGSCSTIRPFG